MAKRTQSLKKSAVEIVDMDELAQFQDADLDTRVSFLFDEMRARGISPGMTAASPYEVELAYAQREQQIRAKRRTAHRAYLNSQDDGYVDESHLPEFKATPPPWYWQN